MSTTPALGAHAERPGPKLLRSSARRARRETPTDVSLSNKKLAKASAIDKKKMIEHAERGVAEKKRRVETEM